MPWKPGQSGNPGGRPKVGADVKELARQYSVDAMKALAEILKNKKATPSARVAAATALLDRGYGKPTQHVEAHVDLIDRLSYDEQQALAAALAIIAPEQGDADEGAEATTH